MKTYTKLVIIAIILITLTAIAHSNPYDFKILRVIDGDTIEVEAPFLPEELDKKLHIRIFGVDTAEKGWRAGCPQEVIKASEARMFVEEEIKKATEKKIIIKRWDKFGGRVLGDVLLDGVPLSKLLIDNNYAIEYYGEEKQNHWCKRI